MTQIKIAKIQTKHNKPHELCGSTQVSMSTKESEDLCFLVIANDYKYTNKKKDFLSHLQKLLKPK